MMMMKLFLIPLLLLIAGFLGAAAVDSLSLAWRKWTHFNVRQVSPDGKRYLQYRVILWLARMRLVVVKSWSLRALRYRRDPDILAACRSLFV
jgi:hypothetical protein